LSGGDVLCFTVGHCHHLLLDRLPVDQAFGEEEHRTACALACVDVAIMVAVAVADEMRRTGIPWVVQTIVERTHDVALILLMAC